MNILYLTDTGDIIGGGEISLLNLLENIDRSRFKSYVVMPYEGNLAKKIKKLDIPVINLPLNKIKNPLNMYRSLRNIKNLIEIIRGYKIDLIHANSTGGITFLGSVASKVAKIPFLWHVRTIQSGGILDLILSLLSARIIVISKAVKHRFWWIPIKNKINLIYNGVDLDRFNTKIYKMIFRDKIGYKEDDFLIGTVGRFVSWKGYEYFLKAAKIVLEKLSNAKFLIVGIDYLSDNKYINYLKRLTKNLSVEEKIIFLGNREDIPQIISSLDLFVLSSIGEPFGRVLIEAMACAKPVVAFRSGGVPEIVEDGVTGFLAVSKDFQGLADKTIYFLRNKDMRVEFGRNGRSRVEKLFDIKGHVKKIENLYIELLEKNEIFKCRL